MSRFLLLSVVIASLSTIVGCGASTRHSAAPSSVAIACDESAWTPPDELAVSFAAPKAAAAATPAQSEDAKMKSSYRPNRNDRPSRGAVHAATY